jgi:biotin carboxyl carrier protein
MSIEVRSPMPGKIIEVLKKAGDRVMESEEIMIMEAMKMEMPIVSPSDGVIEALKVEMGQSVAKEETLALIKKL